MVGVYSIDVRECIFLCIKIQIAVLEHPASRVAVTGEPLVFGENCNIFRSRHPHNYPDSK